MILNFQEIVFSVQLDESSICDIQALLLAFVRFKNDKKICKYMLFCHSLETFCR